MSDGNPTDSAPPSRRRTTPLDRAAIAAFFLAIFALFAAMGIGDPDFWWHLKTGELLLAQKRLPASDPFSSVPFLASAPGREGFILKAYWLTELLYALVHRSFGFAGIKVLKALIYTTLFFIQWRWMRKRDVPLLLALALVGASAYGMLFLYPGERPQVFSFLFSVLVLSLLDSAERGGKWLPALPLVLVLWANMHGGYILGLGLIATYVSVESIQRARRRSLLTDAAYRRLLGAGAASLFSLLLNPNGYEVLFVLRDLNRWAGIHDTTEAMNLLRLYREFQTGTPLALHLSIACAAIASLLLGWRHTTAVQRSLLLALVVAGFLAVRLLAFTILLGIPLTGIALARPFSSLTAGRRALRSGDILRMTGRIAIVLLAVSCIVLAWNVRSDPYDDYDRTLYPDAAADFLLRTGMQGRIFNYYNWGGYLIWRLYPQFRIFVDNRGISDEAYTIHQSILAAGDGWDARLDSLGMNIIVLSPLDILAGQIFPLIPALVHSPSWRLVYYDDKSVLFLRNGPLNAPVIGIYSMPKERAYLTVQAMAAAGIARSPGDADFFLSMGEALNALGQNEEAERYYRHADGLLSSGAGQ